MLTRIAVAAASIALLAAVGAPGAHAQYPPPSGNCALTTSVTTAAVNGTGTVTVIVRDANGAAVAGVPVSLAVTKQSGAGASVTPATATTDSAGKITATLNVGANAGQVEVTATAAGVSCRGSVVVGSGDVSGSVRLPNTGTGFVANDDTPMLGLVLLIGDAVALGGVARRRTAR